MTLTCQTCGEGFERPHRKGPVPKYCSDSHRQWAYVNRRIDRAKLNGHVCAEPALDAALRAILRFGDDVDNIRGLARAALRREEYHPLVGSQ